MSKHEEQQEHQEPNGLDDRFADWVDGRLDERARRELEAELARDPDLRRQAEEYRATVQLLQGHLAEEPPADLVTGVLESVRRERSPSFRLVPMVASLAAAAALVLMVVLFNQPSELETDSPKDVAKHDVADEEEEHDDRAPEIRAVQKDAVRPAAKPQPDATVDTLGEAKTKADTTKAMEELRKQVGEGKMADAKPGKETAKVGDRLQTDPAPAPSKAPSPAAPTTPAVPVQPGAKADQGQGGRRYRGRMEGAGPETQLRELRRITTQVFPAPPRERADQDKFAREPEAEARKRPRLKRVAEKKNKAAAARPLAQVPVVVVQLTQTPVVAGKTEFHKGQKVEQQRQAAQGFLGYLKQQPESWSIGNRVFHQAKAEDLSRALSRPQTGGGAAGLAQSLGQPLVQPGDQLFKVSGSSPQVEKLFQQLKEFLGKPNPQVAVQEAPVGQIPTGVMLFGAQDQKKPEARAQPAGEMQFYLVLRQATPPAMRTRAGRR